MIRLLRLALTALAVAVAALEPAAPVARATSWWAQTVRDVDLWSGPSGPAMSFGLLPRGSYVLVVDPQPYPGEARVYVQESAGRAYGFVDVLALAPSGPPPEEDRAGATPVVGTPLFETFWVANHAETPLWTTPEGEGERLAILPQFTTLLVLAPLTGPRYYVQEALTERVGYVEAHLVGPSGPPDPEAVAALTAPPPPPPSFRPWWVAAHRPTELWSGMAGGTSFGRVVPGEHFLVMEPQDGPRLHVLNPKTKNFAYIDALAVGPAGAPKAAAIEVKGWEGVVTAEVVNLRPEPHTFIAPAAQVRLGDRVTVMAWVEGEEIDPENRMWAQVSAVTRAGPDGAPAAVALGESPDERFIYAGLLRPVAVTSPPSPPANSLGAGNAKWIDVNLTRQYVTAYQGNRAVYGAATTSGRPGWETPTGIFRIQRRVENETMLGSTLLRLDTLEIPTYRLENVKWTQYFTSNGAAIHTNYWRPAALFGMPSSHGCLGMLEEHARWFWNWATIGTPLHIHY